ncbi:UDP-N-acetylmuramate dehydrogenase [Rathayibacter iranicus]|uniref:UDP-N-acetylenolpyruvoylglucosamine reductase n=2 Tax=Rathayibacter iranicus TaxID=59737 RepID=A0AAD1ENU2_9MICO|nr:UDP-N-acetylmuramate dehydrogenase [Rathayibacter iranicus]AZZ57105.1 UDP-N-acetylmuramate dehydrogenase [Rathayibacter iranicus]MWV29732.1 UDP-N-acetylmuramate dehydrogenase [Rathayibacter iranicus NCPPB 2253 = VKM Ac-1602]PPI41443.1 UDP-N-acetylenolpyruvoylglucosamine reductase [Rathayibacter iranicus]PPI57376.1 UDP-N-acetylenolpyruvoylglucosamine reductase [Rathayibacter iranicus]PPI68391.1 UDP-N-acetylenolpyruvoylglucosamine reductase [Rathayibacter iranicus]
MTAPLLSALTTLHVGGPAERLLEPATEAELVATLVSVWSEDEPWLLLGGGSNLLVGDEGVEGTVVRVRTTGVEQLPSDKPGQVRLRVQAGESWDGLVATTVEHGWAGLEALSGIPGTVGASPVQNIGAYGQELSDTLLAVDFLDEGTREPVRLTAADLELGYRTSIVKQGRRGAVLAVEFGLEEAGADEIGAPVAYAQLASALGVALGARVSLAQVRETVLRLRAAKGMVLDPTDPDTASAGSFFTNPLVTTAFAEALPSEAPRWPVVAPGADLVKLSAAWLIEHAGVARGFALPGSRAAVSSKHTLALTNRGGATAAQVAELARFVQSRVLAEFGVLLHPEPVVVGTSV